MKRGRGFRFLEPGLLALLRERPTHGYELIAELPALVGTERVDVGNVYRALRGMEERGLVTSEWSDELPGPAKRTYEITDEGRRALDRVAGLERPLLFELVGQLRGAGPGHGRVAANHGPVGRHQRRAQHDRQNHEHGTGQKT